jgi:hypothetical protein
VPPNFQPWLLDPSDSQVVIASVLLQFQKKKTVLVSTRSDLFSSCLPFSPCLALESLSLAPCIYPFTWAWLNFLRSLSLSRSLLHCRCTFPSFLSHCLKVVFRRSAFFLSLVRPPLAYLFFGLVSSPRLFLDRCHSLSDLSVAWTPSTPGLNLVKKS